MKIILCTLISLALIHISATDARPEAKLSALREVRARVVSCHDGDTCRVQELVPVGKDAPGKFRTGEKFSVRLSGIDAPEIGQESANDAKRYLEDLLKGKEVRLMCDGRSYQRRTCEIFLGDIHVQHELVRQGWAWDSPKYSGGRYAKAQAEARKARIGIWAKDGPSLRSPACHRAKSKQARRNCSRDPRFQE
jgi:micrococcal nuclease